MAEEKHIEKYRSRDGQDVTLTPDFIKRYLVSGKPQYVTMQELYYYMVLCRSRGMNPGIKDCYLVKYNENDPAAIITSIDYYRKRAKARDDCQGWKSGVIVQTKDGQIKYSNGIVIEGEKLLGGWFEALPRGWAEPFKKEVNLKGYIKRTRDGNITRFWSEENQPSQIAKVAEAQGLRAIWGDEFQGLYVDAEMQSEQAQGEFDKIFANALVPGTPESDTVVETTEELEEKVKAVTKDLPWEQVKTFIGKMADTNKVSYDKALIESMKDQTKFIQFVKAWLKQNEKKSKNQEPVKIPPTPPVKPEPEKDPEKPKAAETKELPIWDIEGAGEEKPKFLSEIGNYMNVLSDKNWALVSRLFGVANKTAQEIDATLKEIEKENLLSQCRKSLAKQNA
jgi:phage recombination protein Bet